MYMSCRLACAPHFLRREAATTDPAAQARFLGAMTDLLRSARSAGLGPDDVEAIYRTAVRNCFAEAARP
jgi:hypothetical protein